MSTEEQLQKVWDTCLLQYWRSAGTVLDAVNEFGRQTGKNITDCSLRRVPPIGYPWKVPMRVFIAERLEKIGNRMWDMPQERDKDLVEKLQTSKYDTANQALNPDRELEKERRNDRKNRSKITLETKNYANRNQKTDWNTVK